jgi:hypothetical protein
VYYYDSFHFQGYIVGMFPSSSWEGPTIPTISSHSSDGYFSIISTGHFPFFPIIPTKNKGSYNSDEGFHNSDSKNAFFPQFRRKTPFSQNGMPGRVPPKNFKNIFWNYFWFICDFLLMIFIFYNYFRIFVFVWGASPGSGGCFKKATQTPNAKW